ELRDRTAPEHTADHRGTLEHKLRARRKTVDPRRDQRLERVRNRGAPVLAFGEHAYRLFDEQWIPLGLREHVAADVGWEPGLGEQRVDELFRVVVREGAELDRRAAHPAPAPAARALHELRTSEAEDQHRRVAHPARDVLDEVEERLLRPVDVLERE